MCCVFSSHLFLTSSSLDVPAGVTQEEGHTRFLIHLPSAVRAFQFFSREGFSRSFPSSTVKSNFLYLRFNRYALVRRYYYYYYLFFSYKKSQLPGFELTSQRVRRLRGYQLSYRGDRLESINTINSIISANSINTNSAENMAHRFPHTSLVHA